MGRMAKAITNSTQYTFTKEDKDYWVDLAGTADEIIIPNGVFEEGEELMGSATGNDLTVISGAVELVFISNEIPQNAVFKIKFLSDTRAILYTIGGVGSGSELTPGDIENALGYIPVKSVNTVMPNEEGDVTIENVDNWTELEEWTRQISLDKNYTSQRVMTGPINYTVNNEVEHKIARKRIDYVTANGLDTINFSEDFVVRYNGFVNEQNLKHRVFFEYFGNGKILVDVIYLG